MSEVKEVQIGPAVKYGWESVKKDFLYLVGMAVVVAIAQSIGNYRSDDSSFLGLVSMVLTIWLTGGYLKLLLEYSRQNKLPFEELFKQFQYFWRLLAATILIGLAVGLGTLLLIIPGIYLAIRLQFTTLVIVDQDKSISDAMSESWKLSERKVWPLFLLGLALLGVAILGFIALGVGILVAMPVIWLAQVYVYNQLKSK